MKKGWLVWSVTVALVIALVGGVYADKYKSSEWKKLVGDVETALRGADTETINELIKKVAEDDSKRAVQLLMKLGIEVTNRDVFLQVKTSLASMSSKDALREIAKQLDNNKDVRVRIMLIDVLGEKGDPEFVTEVGSVLMSKKKPEMALLRAAIEALAQMGTKKSMEYLVQYLESIEKERKDSNLMGTDWYEARVALKRITLGEADYEKAADWRKYLESLPDDWKPAAPKEEGDKDSKDALEAWKKGKMSTTVSIPKKTPRIFGTEVVSRTPVFVIDVSGSMTKKDPPDPTAKKEEQEEEKGKGTTPVDPQPKKPAPKPADPADPGALGDDRMRIVRAQNELIKLIKALDSGVMFNIVAYSREVYVWSKTGLKAATEAEKSSAIKFVSGFEAETTTHTDDALEKAWENIKDGCDTLYLLSDGSPTHKGDCSDSDVLIEEILNFFRANNKFKKVKVFTLGFKGANKPFMMKLAKENDGEYKDIK
jgi:hypothetical protein